MKLVIDVSWYQNLTPAQWDLLSAVLDGVIVRCSFGVTRDTMADDHIAQCKRVGLPYACYHWVDPTRAIGAQVQVLSEAIIALQPASIFLDAEQYWTDWAAYMRQDLATAYASRMIPDALNQYYSAFYRAMLSCGVPAGNYSADWFMGRYAPAMYDWITTENYWEARYLRYYDSSWWAAKQKELGKPLPVDAMRGIAKDVQVVKGIGRQFESLVYAQGLPEHLDWNVFTDEGFARMFGVFLPVPTDEPAPPVVPDEPTTLPDAEFRVYRVTNTARVREYPVVTSRTVGYKLVGATVGGIPSASPGWIMLDTGYYMDARNLAEVGGQAYRVTAAFLFRRDAPGGKILGWFVLGAIVRVYRVEGAWAQVDGGWVGIKYLEAV